MRRSVCRVCFGLKPVKLLKCGFAALKRNFERFLRADGAQVFRSKTREWNRRDLSETELNWFRQRLDRLPPATRSVVILWCAYGLGFRDIALALGLTERQVRKHFERALWRVLR